MYSSAFRISVISKQSYCTVSGVLSLLLGGLWFPWIWLCLWRAITKEDLSKSLWVNISIKSKGEGEDILFLNNSKESLNSSKITAKIAVKKISAFQCQKLKEFTFFKSTHNEKDEVH